MTSQLKSCDPFFVNIGVYQSLYMYTGPKALDFSLDECYRTRYNDCAHVGKCSDIYGKNVYARSN